MLENLKEILKNTINILEIVDDLKKYQKENNTKMIELGYEKIEEYAKNIAKNIKGE